MRDQLIHRIREAQRRLDCRLRSDEEQAASIRQEAIEDFKLLLAEKLEFGTRIELLLEGKLVWLDNGPAFRFELDGHQFLLAQEFTDIRLAKAAGEGEDVYEELCILSREDERFEDRLLTAIGSALEID